MATPHDREPLNPRDADGGSHDERLGKAFDARNRQHRRQKQVGSRRPWFARLILDDHKRPFANLANAAVALENDDALSGAFTRDLMARCTLLSRRLPGEDGAEPLPRPVRDCDVARVQRYLQTIGLPRMGREAIGDAIELVAEKCARHPLRDWLDSLVWDKRQRLGSWLADCLGAEATQYSAGIGRMFLVAMVARTFEPGCKVDYLLVLEGSQGSGKSSACRILGGAYFSDALPDIRGGKDVSIHVRDKWLIEVSELSAIGRAEVETLKSFISREVEIYRPSFGRREVHEKRQCAFIGTTNRSTYLRDETGGRRFWPVSVGKIDLDALARDREQLFAEAVVDYRKGVKWWPERQFEAEVIKPEQEARFDDDAWQEPIQVWLSDKQRATITEIAQGALSLEKSAVGKGVQHRIASVLERLGWEHGPRTKTGRPWVKKRVTVTDGDADSPTDRMAADAGNSFVGENASPASFASPGGDFAVGGKA